MCLIGCVELGIILWGGKITTKIPKSNHLIFIQNLPVDHKALHFLSLCLEGIMMMIIPNFWLIFFFQSQLLNYSWKLKSRHKKKCIYWSALHDSKCSTQELKSCLAIESHIMKCFLGLEPNCLPRCRTDLWHGTKIWDFFTHLYFVYFSVPNLLMLKSLGVL